MTRRPPAGHFGGPLSRVRYISEECRAPSRSHRLCKGGPGHRAGELPCSCPCHDPAYMAVNAFLSTACKLAAAPADHAACPPLLAEIPGRREHLPVSCTCDCHRNAEGD